MSNSHLLKSLYRVQQKFAEFNSADNLDKWLAVIATAFNLAAVELYEEGEDYQFFRKATGGKDKDALNQIDAEENLDVLRNRVRDQGAPEIFKLNINHDLTYGCFPISIFDTQACFCCASWNEINSDFATTIAIVADLLSIYVTSLQREEQIASAKAQANSGEIPISRHQNTDADSELTLRELTAKQTDRVESERRRLSRELHDQAGQSLTAILIRLDLVEQKITDPGIKEQLQQIEALAEDTINEIRRISRDLRPAVLDDLGLEEALEGLSSTLSGGTLSINLIIEKPFPRLHEGIETALYRIAQEALNNVIKHAGATVAAVRLQRDEDLVQLEIKDNGIGIDTGSRSEPGIGLLGMKERADSFGGKLIVESLPGSGTRVKVEIPL